MFRNFQSIANRLANTAFSKSDASVTALRNFCSEIIAVASSLASNYAKSYSQVQWMKYDSDGNPQDVTPGDQSTVPDTSIAAAKSSVQQALNGLDSVETTGSVTVVNPKVRVSLNLSGVISYLDDSGVPALGTAADNSVSSPYSAQECTITSSFTQTLDGTSLSFVSGRSYEVGFATASVGDKSAQVLVSLQTSPDVKIMCYLFRDCIGGKLYLFLPPSGQSDINNSNVANAQMSEYPYSSTGESNLQGLFIIYKVLQNAGVPVSTTGSVASYTVGFSRLYQSGNIGQQLSLTVPAIDENVICPGIRDLANAVLNM